MLTSLRNMKRVLCASVMRYRLLRACGYQKTSADTSEHFGDYHAESDSGLSAAELHQVISNVQSVAGMFNDRLIAEDSSGYYFAANVVGRLRQVLDVDVRVEDTSQYRRVDGRPDYARLDAAITGFTSLSRDERQVIGRALLYDYSWVQVAGLSFAVDCPRGCVGFFNLPYFKRQCSV